MFKRPTTHDLFTQVASGVNARHCKGAFTPDANEVLRANDLHVNMLYPHTTTINLSSIVVWDFLPLVVITSLLEQAPDWLPRREYPPKFRFFKLI